MSMGIRPGDEALRARVQRALDAKQPEIEKILKNYGVPMLERKAEAK